MKRNHGIQIIVASLLMGGCTDSGQVELKGDSEVPEETVHSKAVRQSEDNKTSSRGEILGLVQWLDLVKVDYLARQESDVLLEGDTSASPGWMISKDWPLFGILNDERDARVWQEQVKQEYAAQEYKYAMNSEWAETKWEEIPGSEITVFVYKKDEQTPWFGMKADGTIEVLNLTMTPPEHNRFPSRNDVLSSYGE